MAETQLCGLCTNVEEETTFQAKNFDPNQPQLLWQIEKLIGQRVLPQNICTICEEQTQTQQNFATQKKENPKLSEAQPLPTEELASYEINLFTEEQENNDVEDGGALRVRSPLSLLADNSFKDVAINLGDNFNAEDFYDCMVWEEEPTEADGMKLEEINEASLPSYSEVKPPKKNPKSNISKTEKNRQQNSIDSNCELCGKHFALRSSLWSHMKRHTSEKKFKCDICTASYFEKRDLGQHKLRHTWEFACGHCDRRFKQKKDLTHHERNHTEERPYVCPTCGKSFRAWKNRRQHMEIHKGVSNHRCETCDVTFKQRTSLFRHYRSKKHKENVEKPPINMTN